ncbi:MAG: glycosyltransferase family 4 protein [Myxococcota bacterium]|nr:glycosyltransferase family 4 protein [Myxococcota bacterium]
MKVWITNPFDPLPGTEDDHAGRYAALARALTEAGHSVVWWTSEFSHRHKADINVDKVRRAGAALGIDIRCLPVSHYTRNISVSRLRSHRSFAKALRRAVSQASLPDVIVVSAPPLEATLEMTRFGSNHGVPTVVDIQDQWPDTFTRGLPRFAQPFRKLLFCSFYKIERAAYQQATGIVGVANEYLERGVVVGGTKKYQNVLHLGANLSVLDNAMRDALARQDSKWVKPPGQTWVVYGGSLSHSYDFETILHVACRVREEFGQRVRFFVAGDGDLGQRARDLHASLTPDTVSMSDRLSLPEWANLLALADVGLVATFPEAFIYMPNKINDYLAAGVAVLNTLPGEFSELVSRNRCGLNYEAGDEDSLFAAVKHLVENPDEQKAMGVSARRLAETMFDRSMIMGEYVEFLERVASDR